MEERRKTPMVKGPGGEDMRDPSANVILFVGNATAYLERLHLEGQKYYEDKLQLAIEASRRERTQETERINELRENDREAVRVALEQANKQACLLADQMAETAKALHAAQEKTAEALAGQLQSVTKSLDDRLKIVEGNQILLTGTTKGKGDMWGYVVGAVGFVSAIIALFLMLTHPA